MSDCTLSPSAHAFSTVLTAFIGSIINGFTSGALVAFITGWIAWFAFLRVLVAAGLEYWQTFKIGTNMSEAEDTTEYDSIEMTVRSSEPKSFMDRRRGIEKDVSIYGWLGWTWSAVYTPISSSIWLAVNFDAPDGGVKLARAIAVGVSALGLTFDNKQRYAAKVGRTLGPWAFVLFNLWTSTVCLILGAETVVLLIKGALQTQLQWYLYVIYVVASIIWAFGSFKFIPTVNGSLKRVNIFLDVFVGAFAGVFVAAPAFALWQGAKFAADTCGIFPGDTCSEGLSLGDYLSCEVSVLSKFAAVMP